MRRTGIRNGVDDCVHLGIHFIVGYAVYGPVVGDTEENAPAFAVRESYDRLQVFDSVLVRDQLELKVVCFPLGDLFKNVHFVPPSALQVRTASNWISLLVSLIVSLVVHQFLW